MKVRRSQRRRWGRTVLALALFAGPMAVVQATEAPSTSEAASITLSSSLPAEIPADQVLREIDDSSNGVRWLLLRDDRHPGGPGRLVPVVGAAPAAKASPFVEQAGSHAMASPSSATPPLVRVGDPLIVEEHSRVADVQLQAVAVSAAAAAGSEFKVRLKIGGKVVRAVLIEPGRAMLQGDSEARP